MAINNTIENINNQPSIETRTVTGIFTKYMAKTLPLAFDESMSYYECLCALLEYLNETIVPDINNVNDGLSELQQFYLDLQEYVNSYFDTLDVQEEINNKLDNMTEDGTLTSIISSYVDPIYQTYEEEINQDINNFKNTVNGQVNQLNSRVNSLASGSPLVASSIEEMVDTTRTYVNTTDGKWYYYDGDSWEIGGTYQSTGIAENSVGITELSYQFKIDSDNMLNDENPIKNKVWKPNEPVTSNEMTDNTLFESFTAIEVNPGDVFIPLYHDGNVYNHNIDQILWYDEDGQYVSYSSSVTPSNFPITVPTDIHFMKISTRKAYTLSQIKLYENGNYNPNYQPYKYISLIVLKDDISYLDKFNIINTNYSDSTYILSDPSNDNVGKPYSNQYSSTFSASDFVPVIPGNTIKLHNIYAQSNSGACAYDGNKNYVETIIYNSQNTEIEYQIPNNVYYIRYTIKTIDKEKVKGEYYNIKYNDLINSLKNINLNVYNICNTYANKPILTLIDDDCNSSSIPTIKTICDSKNIKCTFACITEKLNTTLTNTLKSYQEDGFHITSHTNSHDRWYKNTTDGNIFTLNECETDLIKSLVKLNENFFIDGDYIVAPGSSFNRENIDKIISKWAKCFVANSYDKSYNNLYTPNQYKLARTMINANTHNLQFYKEWINTAYENKSWIILGSHSYNTSEFDASLYEAIIDYAISKGFEIKTLNEALKERHLIYDIKDLLS